MADGFLISTHDHDRATPPPLSGDTRPSASDNRFPSRTLELNQSLRDLAWLASHAVPGTDGAGVTLVREGRSFFGWSNVFSRTVDEVQYRIGQGPCIDAVDEARTTMSGGLSAGERRWPQFRAEVEALQVRSVLSLPLLVTGQPIGSINLYSRSHDAFDEDAVHAGESFAEPAARSLSTAHLLIGAFDVSAFGSYALTDRATVETAVGVLMGRHSISELAARELLAATAAATAATLATTALQTVVEAQQLRRKP